MLPLLDIFCLIDDFCKHFESETRGYFLTHSQNVRKRKRKCRMHLSEIMTIIVMFQMSHYKTFKDFYICCICQKDFPCLLSYNRFIELMPSAFMPLLLLIKSLKGEENGKYFIDSTKLPVCHNLRINRHKVFKDSAERGKTSTGWFFGFKLHLIINSKGDIMNFLLTNGSIHDVKVVDKLSDKLKGWLFGDKGYISNSLSKSLKERGLELFTSIKKNMKKKILDPLQKHYMKQRNIIETMIGQLKHMMTIDHTRHRSIMNFQVNVLGGLLAYIFKPKKVSVGFSKLNNLKLLTSN